MIDPEHERKTQPAMGEAPDPTLYFVQQLVIDFSLVGRNHFLAGTERRENDSEHTLAVTLMSWFILEKYNLDLDEAKVLKYALAHDLIEARAGDVNAFASDAERQQKVEDEAVALEALSGELADFGGLVVAMQGYEDKEDDEAVFVWTVDKVQALIMGEMDEWRPYRILDINYQSFCDKYKDVIARSSPHIREIFETMIEHFKAQYYDQPEEGALDQ